MSDNYDELLQALFDRPTEFVFMPKGNDNSIVFDVPDRYVKYRYRKVKTNIVDKFSKPDTKNIPIENIALPDLTEIKKLGLKENFTLFYPRHAKIADSLIEIFMNQRNADDLISVAAYCRDRVNPYMFNYALSVALLHRTDTKNVQVPNFLQCFPGKFIDSSTFSSARREAVAVPKAVREPIVLARDFTATSKEPEQAIAYFREDIGINLHHWHWHLVYPFMSSKPEIVDKDRRGELFFYMHHQILARYNAERFSNGMARVKSYKNLREAVDEAYFPKLEMAVASRTWPPRFRNTPLSDVDRIVDQLVVKISDIEMWIKNCQEAIKNGYAVDTNGIQIPLSDFKGIDVLGNMLEASTLSPNAALYGDFHNMGHVIISVAHDPDNRFLESFAVMGDTATAMRDPVFYRWHNFVNDMLLSHKNTLPKYTVADLAFDNVRVKNVQVTINKKPTNELLTFWEQSDVDLSRGLDFSPRSPVYVRLTHLQQEEFDFVVNVNNSSKSQLLGTMRIFIAPVNNEKGVPMTYDEQRLMMIEMDRFRVTLLPGNNTIKRNSLDSSVTIPYERTFRSIDAYSRPTGDDTNPALNAFNFCGCGWPQHMFVPRGTTDGMPFYLFAMVSDYKNDSIEQDVGGVCNDADSYCGIQDKKYPDKQSMGYPFDRVGRDGVKTLTDFLTPNMKVEKITIKYEDRTVLRKNKPGSNYSVVPPPDPK